MPDIITMPDSLYFFTASQFNLPTALNTTPGSTFNPVPRIDGPRLQLWRATLTLMPRGNDRGVDDLDDLIQFLLRLDGGLVLARIYDKNRVAGPYGRVQPKGAGGATSTVNIKTAAAAGATQVTLKNLLPNEATSLKAIDHIGIGENLYVVVNSGSSDANGWGTFDIRPALRMAVAEGDPVTLVKPTGLFRLTGGFDELVQHSHGHHYSEQVTLTFVEDPLVA